MRRRRAENAVVCTSVCWGEGQASPFDRLDRTFLKCIVFPGGGSAYDARADEGEGMARGVVAACGGVCMR